MARVVARLVFPVTGAHRPCGSVAVAGLRRLAEEGGNLVRAEQPGEPTLGRTKGVLALVLRSCVRLGALTGWPCC